MITKSFQVRVGADTKDMERGLKTAQARMKAFGNQVKKIGKVAAVAGAAVAGAVGLMVRNYIKAGDEVHKMALRTGFSTEALSELKYAADISGTTLESLEKGVKKMSKTIMDASDGLMTYVRAFDRIGLSAQDLIDLSPEEQFDKIARAIARVESPTIRAATAQEIFGRAGTQLLPLFAAGAEGLDKLRKKAHELGLVFDQEAADKAAKLTDSITTLKGSLTGLTRNIAGELVPTLTILADHFTETFVGLQDESKTLASMIVTVFETIVGAVGGTLTGLKAFYISMLTLNKQLAEGLIAIVEAIELTVVQTRNLALITKVVPLTAEALEKLNKVREIDIELIKKEEERLLNLVNFFKDLQLAIATAGDRYKGLGNKIRSVLPPARELGDVFQVIMGTKLIMPPIAMDLPKMSLEDWKKWYKQWHIDLQETWNQEWEDMMWTVRTIVGQISGILNQLSANQMQLIDNEEQRRTEALNSRNEKEIAALESWYEREKEKIETTITNEEEKNEALAALAEVYAGKENDLAEAQAETQAKLEEDIEKKRRKAIRKQAIFGKAVSLASAVINIAEAITKALTLGPFLGVAAATWVKALGAIQIAAIVAAPLPSLAKGGMIEKEGVYRLHPGEEVRSAAAVKTQPGTWNFSPTVNIYTKYLDDRTINQAAGKIFVALEREKRRFG